MKLIKLLRIFPEFRKMDERLRCFQLASDAIEKTPSIKFKCDEAGWIFCTDLIYEADAENFSALTKLVKKMDGMKNRYGGVGPEEA